MEDIQAMAGEVFVSLALGVLSLLGAYGIYYIRKAADKLRAQTQALTDDKQRKLLNDALTDVEHLAGITVEAIEQTTAHALREAVKDGSANREELLELGSQAFKKIKDAIGPEAQRVITENLGSFDFYLSALIESHVLALKTATGQ